MPLINFLNKTERTKFKEIIIRIKEILSSNSSLDNKYTFLSLVDYLTATYAKKCMAKKPRNLIGSVVFFLNTQLLAESINTQK